MYRKQIIVHSWTKMIHALIYRGSGGDGPPPLRRSQIYYIHIVNLPKMYHPPPRANTIIPRTPPPPLRPEKKWIRACNIARNENDLHT